MDMLPLGRCGNPFWAEANLAWCPDCGVTLRAAPPPPLPEHGCADFAWANRRLLAAIADGRVYKRDDGVALIWDRDRSGEAKLDGEQIGTLTRLVLAGRVKLEDHNGEFFYGYYQVASDAEVQARRQLNNELMAVRVGHPGRPADPSLPETQEGAEA